MNYQTRLGEYFHPETAPVGSGPAIGNEQLNLSDFKENGTYDSIRTSDKHDKRATGRVTKTLDTLINEGTPLTSDLIVQECQEKQVSLGTINIKTGNMNDVEAVTGCIKRLLRKSDHVYHNNGSITILAPVSDQGGLYVVLNKIKNVIDAARELNMGSVKDNDIHMTYQPDVQIIERPVDDLNLPSGAVELMDIALGKEDYDPTKQVYLSSSGSLADVKNYINTVHALNPTLLPELEMVFACTNEFAQLNFSQLDESEADLGDSYFDQKWHLQHFNVVSGNRHVETTFDHLIDEDRFVVVGYEPGKPFEYKTDHKKIVPQTDSV